MGEGLYERLNALKIFNDFLCIYLAMKEACSTLMHVQMYMYWTPIISTSPYVQNCCDRDIFQKLGRDEVLEWSRPCG